MVLSLPRRQGAGRRGARNVRVPPIADASLGRAFLQTIGPGHVNDSPAVRQPTNNAAIRRLHAFRDPAAVPWGVAPIALVSLNGEIRGISVLQGPAPKGSEVVDPLGAKADAAAAIVLPADGVRVGASGAHPGPDAKQPRARIAVRSGGEHSTFILQAPAGLRFPFAQAVAGDTRALAAIALAQPRHIGLDGPISAQDDQPPESASRQIDHRASSHGLMIARNVEGWA